MTHDDSYVTNSPINANVCVYVIVQYVGMFTWSLVIYSDNDLFLIQKHVLIDACTHGLVL